MPQTEETKVDCCIVVYNNASTISECISSLSGQKSLGKIIIVDNSPNNETYNIIKNNFPEVTLIKADSNLGFGAGQNLAIKESENDWILIFNPDAFFRNNEILSELIKSSIELEKENSKVILGPKILYPNGSEYPSGRNFPRPISGTIHSMKSLFGKGSKRYLKPESNGDQVVKVDWISGSAMFMRKKTFTNLNGFDSERFFMYCEDMDLCFRNSQNEGITYKNNQIDCYHIGAVSSGGGNLKTVYWHHKSIWKFISRSFHGLEKVLLPIFGLGLIFHIPLTLVSKKLVRIKDAG